MWLDIPLLVFQGLAGIIVSFLFFFSSHPAVDSNWLIIILNPIPLFYAGWIICCQKKGKRNTLSYLNIGILVIFSAIMLIGPQKYNPAMYLLVLTFLVRALSQGHFAYHQK